MSYRVVSQRRDLVCCNNDRHSSNAVELVMTYCVATLLDTGLVFLSDSRTNAGVDHVNTFRKMHVFERSGDRVLVLMTSGNLAVSQAVVHELHECIAQHDAHSLYSVKSAFDAAALVGEALRAVHQRDAASLKEHGIDFNAAFILGGQIRGEAPRLFHIYAAGNFIEATEDTPYFQIGESKYGKPILDRVITRSSSIAEATKCALISMDSTIRSNLSVGLPLDLVCVRRDVLKIHLHRSITAEDEYFRMIRSGWSDSLRHAFHTLPNPTF
jgi:putative proteasome-type protease